MAGVAGGIARFSSGGDLDHGALWRGAHPEPPTQETRAAPQLCAGRSALRDRPVRRLSPGGWLVPVNILQHLLTPRPLPMLRCPGLLAGDPGFSLIT